MNNKKPNLAKEPSFNKKSCEKQSAQLGAGFTLLELLIVIAIIAILSVILIIVLNPVETLRKARDSQRISDLSTMKTALGIYVTSVTSPDLDGTGGVFLCLTGTAITGKISYSSVVADPVCSATVAPGSDTSATFGTLADFCFTAGATASTVTSVDGTGWVPVNLGSLTGGSPISNLPIDPVNTSITTTPASTDLVYRYACQSTGATGKPSQVFEFDAQLESAAFTTSPDDKRATDGGDNTNYYEVGTSVRLIGTGTNF